MANYILSSYFGDIFFDFIVQEEPADTILVLEGFPSKGRYTTEIEFLYNQGFNVIWPHYPGSYQSRGKFLEKNIVLELAFFVDNLKKSKTISLWDSSEVSIQTKKLYLFGSSFSGAICAGLLTMRSFDKAVFFSPVWDFEKHNQKGNEQDLNSLIPFVKRAYENLFRFDWNNLVSTIKKFQECSSDYYVGKINIPLLVLHDSLDNTVSIEHTYDMKNKIPFDLIEHSQGHSMRKALEFKWDKIDNFLKK